jgi:ankyrin repeat protein
VPGGKFGIKVIGATLIAVAAIGLAIFSFGGGCDRRKGGVGMVVTPSKSTDKNVTVIDDTRPKVETDPVKLLRHHLLYRDAGQVSKILKEHPELVDKEIDKVRPLFAAAEKGSLPLVQAVVDAGADLKARNRQHQTVLRPAVASDSLELVKFLASRGCDLKDLQDDDETLLFAAMSKEMAEYLISAGVDPKKRNNYNDTPLHEQCRNARKDVAQVLLDHGLNVEVKGHWNMPPLHSAACTMTSDPDPRKLVLFLLERGADINSRGYNGHTALHECAIYNCYDMAVVLLSHEADPALKDDDRRTPLDLAKLSGQVERQRLINLLIRRGAEGIQKPIDKDGP